jgi:hypothetical protein
MGQFYYSGTLVVLIFFVASILLCHRLYSYRYKWNTAKIKTFANSNRYFILCSIAFIISLGRSGWLWQIMSSLPVFNKFSNPFKFLLFVNFFASLFGAQVLEKNWDELNRRYFWVKAVPIVVVMLIIYHSSLCKSAYYTFHDYPYPKLSAFEQKLGAKQGRILSLAPERYPEKSYTRSMRLNFPTLYGTYSLDGYDPLVSFQSIDRTITRRIFRDSTLDWYKALGVNRLYVFNDQTYRASDTIFGNFFWHYCHRFAIRDSITNFELQTKKQILGSQNRIVMSDSILTIYEFDGADPMVFLQKAKEVKIPWISRPDGILIDVPERTEISRLIVNFTNRPFFRASVNGNMIPLSSDKWGRILIDLPKGKATSIRITYIPPWSTGLLAGLILSIASITLLFFRTNRQYIATKKAS